MAEPKAPRRPGAGTWAVALACGEWELGEIAPHFAGSIRVERRDGWGLGADEFSNLEDPSEVLVRARELVALINGLDGGLVRTEWRLWSGGAARSHSQWHDQRPGLDPAEARCPAGGSPRPDPAASQPAPVWTAWMMSSIVCIDCQPVAISSRPTRPLDQPSLDPRISPSTKGA